MISPKTSETLLTKSVPECFILQNVSSAWIDTLKEVFKLSLSHIYKLIFNSLYHIDKCSVYQTKATC